VPIFMKMDGVKGECTQAGFEGQVEIESIQFGVGMASSREASGGFSFTAPSFSEVSISCPFDSGTMMALSNMLKADHAANTLFTFARTEGTKLVPYMTKTLTESYITSISAASGGERPSVSMSLVFGKIELNWTELAKDGKTATKAPKVVYDVGKATLV
jgi:type VI secretion system secreted protein Hcp